MRVTILCPEDKAAAFAPFLASKALNAADQVRFPAMRWRDLAGVRFCAASFEDGGDAAAHWAAVPTLPGWADAATLDLTLAGLCHATLHLIGPDEAILPAANDGLTIVLGREGGDVLDLCGLSQDLPMDI